MRGAIADLSVRAMTFRSVVRPFSRMTARPPSSATLTCCCRSLKVS